MTPHMYHGNAMAKVERIQTGLRIEKRLLKVLKGLAEHFEMSLGELTECIVLHAFDGRPVFSEDTRARIAKLREVYDLELTADDSHKLREDGQ